MDIKALVVDDEQLAREELCYLLEQAGGITVVWTLLTFWYFRKRGWLKT